MAASEALYLTSQGLYLRDSGSDTQYSLYTAFLAIIMGYLSVYCIPSIDAKALYIHN